VAPFATSLLKRSGRLFNTVKEDPMQILLQKLHEWAEKLPENQKKLFQTLVSQPEPKMPAKQLKADPLLKTVSVYTLLRGFFRFVVPFGSTRAASWMETPEPPWPRWSQKDPWYVCYYAGPQSDMYQDIRLVETGEKGFRIAEKTCRSFCRRLDYFSRKLPPENQVQLKALILQSMHPIQRMRLIGSDKILTRSERLLVSKLKARFRSVQDQNGS
jgi:hypothetical protein